MKDFLPCKHEYLAEQAASERRTCRTDPGLAKAALPGKTGRRGTAEDGHVLAQ
jgi:hypothetical protein